MELYINFYYDTLNLEYIANNDNITYKVIIINN